MLFRVTPPDVYDYNLNAREKLIDNSEKFIKTMTPLFYNYSLLLRVLLFEYVWQILHLLDLHLVS